MPCTILPLLLSSLFPKPGHEQESNRVDRPGRVMAGFRQDGTELTAAQSCPILGVVRVFYDFIITRDEPKPIVARLQYPP